MTYLVSLCSSTLCSRICRARAKKRLWPPREYAALALRLIIVLRDHCILRHYVMDVKSICRCCSIAEARLLGSPQLSTFLTSTAVLAQKTHHSAQVLFWAFLLGIVPPMNVLNLRVRHQSGQQLATGDTIGIVDANNHEDRLRNGPPMSPGRIVYSLINLRRKIQDMFFWFFTGIKILLNDLDVVLQAFARSLERFVKFWCLAECWTSARLQQVLSCCNRVSAHSLQKRISLVRCEQWLRHDSGRDPNYTTDEVRTIRS